LERRLAAILAADVVGYTRLMSADETGTLERLKSLRKELVQPKITERKGRIVKLMGDGLLAEFPSVVEAVQCAADIQQSMVGREAELPDAQRIRLRIGVNLGDIIVEGSDIYGDGVNVAARLEGLAEPGGICVSGTVFDHVKGKVGLEFADLGAQQVKNIEEPVRVYGIALNGGAEASKSAGAPLASTAGPELPDKPSIAVLPFNNMSGDPEQEYFADGMTEDLITDLSKISGMFVVARNSSFAFKGQPIDVRKAARRLGVRYVLEGSVRKAGSRIRINAQLIDALSGGHLWAERYDGTVENVFELQDDVGAKVVSALAVRLKGDESARLQRVHTRNLAAYELYVRAKATPYPPVSERIDAARQMFEQVIELDSEFAGGYAGVSWMLAFSAMWGHFDAQETIARATALARKAVEVDDTFGWSYAALGLALLLQGQHEEAIAAADEAVARQPNDADAHAYRGIILAFAGHPELGLEPVERAIRLNPQFINSPYLNLRSGIMFLAQDYDGAVRAYEENVERHGPVGPPVLSWAAAAYWALGRRDDAERTAAQLAAQFPAFRLENWNFFKLIRSSEDRRRIHNLMRAAGLPQ
jgi:adenylate cyclase